MAPARILASAKMAGLVGYLRRTCDVVIFTAPSLAAAETRALAVLSDAMLVVAREDSPAHSTAGLQAFSGTQIGVVLAR